MTSTKTYQSLQTMKKNLLIVLLAICSAFGAQATHIVGGEMNYRCLGNNQYELSLTVFRDCYNGVPPFDVEASIGIFNSNDVLLMDVRIPFIQDDTLQPVLFDTCLVIPPSVCVHRTTYIDTITLPFITGGYKILYQRCCRNNTIVNITNPSNTGATFYTFITETGLVQCNSNPVYNEWPPIYICAGTPIVFDHSALDIDGDSLVYELCAPFDASTVNPSMPQPPFAPTYNSLLYPYDTVSWVPPYSTTNMMGGVPLAIHRSTGLLTGTPNILGQFVVGICVKEYRNGQLIGITKRDFQYNVGTCSSSFSADISAPDVLCDGFEVQFNNLGFGGNYYWDFGDLTISSDTSILQHPNYTYSDTGIYTVTLISGYGDPCADTATHIVSIETNQITWNVEAVYDACQDTVTVQFYDQTQISTGTAVAWDWNFLGVGSDSVQNPTVTFSGSTDGSYLYRMIVTSSSGCQSVGIGKIVTDPIELDFEIGEQVCPGQEMYISAISLDPEDTISYHWQPENEIISGENDSVILTAPYRPTYYILETSQHTCIQYDTILIDPSQYAPPLDIFADPDSIFPGEVSQISATDDLDYSYSWFPFETLTDSSIFNPIANPLETTEYILTVTDDKGCIAVDTIVIFVRPFECEMPYIFIPNAFTPNDDGKNDVLYVRANGVDEFHFALFNRWGQKVFETNNLNQGWDGAFNGIKVAPDVFGYVLQVNCLNGGQYFKKGNITLIR